MPSHLSADRPSVQPPGRGAVDALIVQARRLEGEVDAVRRETQEDTADPKGRWERALCDLALHQLGDLGACLAQLRDGPPPLPAARDAVTATPVSPPEAASGALLGRAGSAEWNLLTGQSDWSVELYRILGCDPAAPALSLDELPSLVHDEDRPRLTAMVTGCLVDAMPVDGEFRVVRPDGTVRTVHMTGEPVLDADGGTASMWAVLRDVSELRRGESVVREIRDSLRDHRHLAQPEHRLVAEPATDACCRRSAASYGSRTGAPRPSTWPPTACPRRPVRGPEPTGTTHWSCPAATPCSASASSPGPRRCRT
jgi:hypothetical protein